MPIQYKSYGCTYKCGFRHTSDYYKAYKHEQECWYNPQNRTCLTCKHEDYSVGYAGEYNPLAGINEPPEEPYRDCKLEIEFKDSDPGIGNRKLKTNCKMWEVEE
jgi:hypothetical protein